MQLIKTTFTFQWPSAFSGDQTEVTAIIQEISDVRVWTVSFFDWRNQKRMIETVVETRRTHYVSPTRAREIVAYVFKQLKK